MPPLERAGPAVLLMLLLTLAAVVLPARADDVGGEEPEPWEVIEDPILRDLRRLDAIAPFEDLAPLREHIDAGLQRQLEKALDGLGLGEAVQSGQVSVALVDVSRARRAARRGGERRPDDVRREPAQDRRAARRFREDRAGQAEATTRRPSRRWSG